MLGGGLDEAGERAFVTAFEGGLGYQVGVVGVYAGDGEGLAVRAVGHRGWPLPWRGAGPDHGRRC